MEHLPAGGEVQIAHAVGVCAGEEAAFFRPRGVEIVIDCAARTGAAAAGGNGGDRVERHAADGGTAAAILLDHDKIDLPAVMLHQVVGVDPRQPAQGEIQPRRHKADGGEAAKHPQAGGRQDDPEGESCRQQQRCGGSR